MAPFTVIVANFVVAAALAAGATFSPRLRDRPRRSQIVVATLLAGLALLDGVLLVAFVFGEDDYRGNGISRWDAYRSPGGALGPMFVASLGVLAVAAGLLMLAGMRRRPHLLGATALVASVGCVLLVTPTILGFSLN